MREPPVSAGLPGFQTNEPAAATAPDADITGIEQIASAFATTNIIALFLPSRSAPKSMPGSRTQTSIAEGT